MKRALMAIGTALLMAGTAEAASVTWNGAVFSVELTGFVGNNYSFLYTANFNAFTGGGHTDYIWGINFKPSSGDVVGFSGFSTTSPGTWNTALSDTNLSANGCSGAGADFFCAEAAVPGALTSGVHTWSFTLSITGVTNPDRLVGLAPIRALFGEYNDSNGRWQTSLMSESTGDVPEPGALALFGVGLLGFAIRLRRRH